MKKSVKILVREILHKIKYILKLDKYFGINTDTLSSFNEYLSNIGTRVIVVATFIASSRSSLRINKNDLLLATKMIEKFGTHFPITSDLEKLIVEIGDMFGN